MGYDGILEFKGTWRAYQARVLKNADRYMRDGKIHIVAAPGSGKTTLGIELIRRMGRPALVLAPSITIREQWVARIEEAFLCDGVQAKDYLSQNLKAPKAITVVTYQALHSAVTRFNGAMEEEAGEAAAGEGGAEHGEAVDFSDFDLIAAMKNAGISVLCLDECHHLRSEWWKALEEFKKQLGSPGIIALTATPPYDSTPAMWKRYMDMCGEIDEEITVPELVKEGSLCPHQDFVYFNYPTKEEEAEIARFTERSRTMRSHLMQDADFEAAVRTHGSLTGQMTDEALLENPSALAAVLIYLQAKRVLFPSRLQNLLGAGKLPKMDAEWMEKLLQDFLYDGRENYACGEEYREKLTEELKAAGLIEKRKVCFAANDATEKLLLQSKGKSSSIREIAHGEYEALGGSLRMLILTDYIRKEYEMAVGNPEGDVNALGVLPFFELLRRDAATRNPGLRLGILCGTVVVIPAEAKGALERAAEGVGKITFSAFGALHEMDYLKVNVAGDAHFLTGAVTELFAQGYIHVLIGTKSLLGEGWDSPCVNSLILASFVGSFMLSNQMRGRAIRVWKEQPDKTSNIWHLVCLRPGQEAAEDAKEDGGDYAMLVRRMEHFLGLNDTEDVIESGMRRLSMIRAPFDQENVARMNREMLALSRQRDVLKERWQRALMAYRRMDVVEETEVCDAVVTTVVFRAAMRKAVILGITAVLLFAVTAFLTPKGAAGSVLRVGAVAALAVLLAKMPILVRMANPYRRLKSFGEGIKKALLERELLEDKRCRVIAGEAGGGRHTLCLQGDSGRDKALFAQCVREFFEPVDNQRYLLVKAGRRKTPDRFYCVPECFGRKKEDAEVFASCMRSCIGNYELVYTRSETGRALLLEGRMQALANRMERCVSHKKVKSALE